MSDGLRDELIWALVAAVLILVVGLVIVGAIAIHTARRERQDRRELNDLKSGIQEAGDVLEAAKSQPEPDRRRLSLVKPLLGLAGLVTLARWIGKRPSTALVLVGVVAAPTAILLLPQVAPTSPQAMPPAATGTPAPRAPASPPAVSAPQTPPTSTVTTSAPPTSTTAAPTTVAPPTTVYPSSTPPPSSTARSATPTPATTTAAPTSTVAPATVPEPSPQPDGSKPDKDKAKGKPAAARPVQLAGSVTVAPWHGLRLWLIAAVTCVG